MRTSLGFVACCLVVGSVGAMGAQKAKPKPKPKPPGLGSIGTTQLPGATCKFGTAYTLGKKGEAIINLCVTSAEYMATRVKTANTFVFPKAETKLLVVHFTLHNPISQEQAYGRWLNFTAVTSAGQNASNSEAWIEAAPNARLEVTLKPAQKIAGYVIIEVPAAGDVDKLMVENASSTGSPVARYPLAGLVKKIAPPYVDPADPKGTTPLKLIKAKLGEVYEIDDTDCAVTKVEQVETPTDPLEPTNEGETYVLVTFQVTARNEIGGTMNVGGGNWHNNALVDTDGASGYAYNNGCLRTSTVAYFQPSASFGEPVTFRRAYIVKRGTKLNYVKLCTDTSREVRWDLAGFTAK